MTQKQIDDAITLARAAHVLSGMSLAILDGKPTDYDLDDLRAIFGSMGARPSSSEGGDHEEQDPENPIDPEWFTGANRHLSTKGQLFIFGLWEQGKSPNQAAKRMGIHWGPANAWFIKFKNGYRP